MTPDQTISRDRKQVTVATVAPPSLEDQGDIHSFVVITVEINTTLNTGTALGDYVSLETPDSKVTVVNTQEDLRSQSIF